MQETDNIEGPSSVDQLKKVFKFAEGLGIKYPRITTEEWIKDRNLIENEEIDKLNTSDIANFYFASAYLQLFEIELNNRSNQYPSERQYLDRGRLSVNLIPFLERTIQKSITKAATSTSRAIIGEILLHQTTDPGVDNQAVEERLSPELQIATKADYEKYIDEGGSPIPKIRGYNPAYTLKLISLFDDLESQKNKNFKNFSNSLGRFSDFSAAFFISSTPWSIVNSDLIDLSQKTKTTEAIPIADSLIHRQHSRGPLLEYITANPNDTLYLLDAKSAGKDWAIKKCADRPLIDSVSRYRGLLRNDPFPF